MQEEKLKKLLNELAEITTESVRPGLAEDVKDRIPSKLVRHRGMDTINIIIDLRIGKLAAAAVIIITMILSAHFLSVRDATGDSIYEDSKVLVKYCLGGEDATRDDMLASMAKFHEYLVHQGEDVVYYGDSLDPGDADALVMQWKLSDGKYRIVLGDLSVKIVTAEELIKLQARMLQKKTK